MREIKFRIWDKKNDRWFHGGTDEQQIKSHTDAISLFGETICFGEILRDQNDDKVISLDRIKDLVALQFTGLKDKNGKEIYENDIVEYDTEDGIYRTVIKFTMDENDIEDIGEYNNFLSGFTFSSPWRSADSDDDGHYEVIGNIYENPELLVD